MMAIISHDHLMCCHLFKIISHLCILETPCIEIATSGHYYKAVLDLKVGGVSKF